MASLYLDYDVEEIGGCDLQDWLGGQWALLFSHPRDFQYLGAKQQRWLDALRQDSRACAVRLIALNRGGGPLEASWVDELLGDRRLIQLRDPPSDATAEARAMVSDLRKELRALESRFVLILDGSLRRRDVLQYSPGRCVITVHDLLAAVDVLRHPRPLSSRLRQPQEAARG